MAPIVETKADIKFDLEGDIGVQALDKISKKNTKKMTNLKTGNKSDRKRRQVEMLKQ